MRAIILAAGRGTRLASFLEERVPKCLIKIGAETLLQRHLRLLHGFGVQTVHIVVGFNADLITEHAADLDVKPEIVWHHNDRYREGSVISLYCALQGLVSRDPILLMDADVLYNPLIVQRLINSEHQNCFLMDRNFERGPEPVKICIRNDKIVEFRKEVADGLRYDTIGESVGFFKFSAHGATRLAEIVAEYDAVGNGHRPHEEALRDLALERSMPVGVEDITGMTWIEIDFPEDIKRAMDEILPALGKQS
jgi:choline kinase